MEGRLKRSFAESPLYGFVREGWFEWGQNVCSVQVQEDDFALYLTWALDLIKEEREDVASRLWGRVYMALRDRFIASDFSSNKDDLAYLTDLVCACAYYCFGLVLTGDFDNQRLFCELTKGFGDHKDGVMRIWEKMGMDERTPELKEWLVEYMGSEEFYTSGERIEWLEPVPENLPDIARIARGPVQVVQVNIEQFNNAPGASFTDRSLNVKIEGDYGEYKQLQ